MADIIKMNYGQMEEMAQAFAQGAQQLETTISEMNTLAQMMENGGLMGDAGDSFTDAIRSALIPSIQRLMDKFTELQGDILGAMQDMQQADQDSSRLYG
ncbi:MAG: WXG100 family type VII secretion target [Ardenticatenaceae bacterium]|nr:WXG100 family type VII secretion target [Anaerolineales bacterium]MCB8921422.1 WXG100 family type VII secretion target [Ardenticatenaceae bacterium]MCB8991539.1 WXG100 family type VII secretion target [Ardenticatenaceae bacterium]MCB9005099.1 WXG100 family type VII secretion target [Ardenticatenaceae bacterium]